MGSHGYLVLDGGVQLALHPGRRFVARVVRVEGASAVVSLAGAELRVAVTPGARLRAGETVSLAVGDVGQGRLTLRLETQG
jgi:hypothetical protein